MNATGDSTAVDSVAALVSQWANPGAVIAVVQLLGGDVVHKALAEGSGSPYFSPVCFSFGWVTYAFNVAANIIGDGCLLPPPDYPAKVFNLKSGYRRENRNWVVGRLLRDLSAAQALRDPIGKEAIRISVFVAKKNPNQPYRFPLRRGQIGAAVVIALQLGLSAIPFGLYGDWTVLLATGIGTFLAQIMGTLPQWTAEKLPNRQHSEKMIALTSGNGSRDIIVIIGNGCAPDLEDLAVPDSPRTGRMWEKFATNSEAAKDEKQPRRSRLIYGLPRYLLHTAWLATKTPYGTYGYLLTTAFCVILPLYWLAFLITIGSFSDSAWYLLGVGLIGTVYNTLFAAWVRSPTHRNFPLFLVDTIKTRKVMNGLMDFHSTYGCGEALLQEFFPGNLRADEKTWWDGSDQDPYDMRRKESGVDGIPRRLLPPVETYVAQESHPHKRASFSLDIARAKPARHLFSFLKPHQARGGDAAGGEPSTVFDPESARGGDAIGVIRGGSTKAGRANPFGSDSSPEIGRTTSPRPTPRLATYQTQSSSSDDAEDSSLDSTPEFPQQVRDNAHVTHTAREERDDRFSIPASPEWVNI